MSEIFLQLTYSIHPPKMIGSMVGSFLILTFVHSRRRKEEQISSKRSKPVIVRISTLGVLFHC